MTKNASKIREILEELIYGAYGTIWQDHKEGIKNPAINEAEQKIRLLLDKERREVIKLIDQMIVLKVMANANPMFNSEEVTIAIEQFADDIRTALNNSKEKE